MRSAVGMLMLASSLALAQPELDRRPVRHVCDRPRELRLLTTTRTIPADGGVLIAVLSSNGADRATPLALPGLVIERVSDDLVVARSSKPSDDILGQRFTFSRQRLGTPGPAPEIVEVRHHADQTRDASVHAAVRVRVKAVPATAVGLRLEAGRGSAVTLLTAEERAHGEITFEDPLNSCSPPLVLPELDEKVRLFWLDEVGRQSAGAAATVGLY